ncbi:MAG TPA: DUF4384 domain-containing protein [Blastocatellia bacterium]|nr:DUF4384 domain-containing protein [Blastocatellia bacterium]
MSNRSGLRRRLWIVVAIVLALGFGTLLAFGLPGQDEDNSRGIWPEVFAQKRPPAAGKNTATRAPVGKIKPAAGSRPDSDAMVGVTIWRLRVARAGDDKEAVRILRPQKGSTEPVEWTLERIEDGKPIPAGENVRLGVEVPRSGYLYVIDREEFAGNKLSEPYLIFPNPFATDNRVTAGKLIEIPPDREGYFASDPKPDQVSEVLTLLVTPTPLSLKIGPDPITPLATEQFTAWEKKWGVPSERIKVRNAPGLLYTKAEKAAASGSSGSLTPDDLLPQTIYKLAAKPGAALLVNVRLQYR